MVDAIMSLFGAEPELPDRTAFETEGLHIWALIQVTSLKLIIYRALGRGNEISGDDIDLLISTQKGHEIWEGNILIHLSVLNALAGLPATEEVVARGVDKVLRHQRVDGGFPFVTDTDTWCTATGGLALAAAGANEGDLHRIARHLVRQQRSNGGWAYTDIAQQTDVDDTSVAVEFMHSLDARRYKTSINAGLDFLRSVRHDQGGFPTYVRSAAPEACMTAAAVNALGVDAVRNAQALQEGIRFLAAAQKPDGGFEPDWSASALHTVFRVVLATGQQVPRTSAVSSHIRARALTLVHISQNGDGGWGWGPDAASDAVSSSYALIALCSQSAVEPAVRAAEYILSCQKEDGSIASRSDSIGPRPFIFRIPVLADIFAMLALGHLASRLAPTIGISEGPTILEERGT
ncbi:prenyltransferase/squalene oxidase repeat-containing protein [Streptomyces sp. 3211]|uniref:prenyltransferase/squalene oxidase repeat-containing protein n=1 Tax=Streptomyces sp. 3211 TaxID=1964449 RepID=UPI00133194A1|nr:prenyltransferase/squalene oxidase repeat-containing protein [Streptomyces sp. 3211]